MQSSPRGVLAVSEMRGKLKGLNYQIGLKTWALNSLLSEVRRETQKVWHESVTERVLEGGIE